MKQSCSTVFFLYFVFHACMSWGQSYNDNQMRIGEIEYVYTTPEYRIIDTFPPSLFNTNSLFKYIVIENAWSGVFDSIGFPELPFLTFNFEVPYNSQNHKVSIKDMVYDTIGIEAPILPNQGDFNKEFDLEDYIFQINKQAYFSDNKFVDEFYRPLDTFIIRGTKGVRLIVMPFEYNPYRMQLYILKSAKFVIRYQEGREQQLQPYSATWNNILSSVFENHSVETRRQAVENYLILTLPQYTDAIQYFADYKQSLGYNVKIHTLSTNQHTPAAIRQLIRDYYSNIETRPDFILLVGDHPDLPA